MTEYRTALPQLSGDLYLTDGGIETTLIFLEGQDLPDFAAFHLLSTPEGEDALRKYFRTYATLARRLQIGLILETATWRASRDWGDRLGYNSDALAQANAHSVLLLQEIRETYATPTAPVVISGCVGPRGDGYAPDQSMSEEAAEAYHRAQINVFADTAADLVTAITMNYSEEAIGIARAAQRADMPVVISFTVETDGKLPTGQTLQDAVSSVDNATSAYPAYYMINCAHPSHFVDVLDPGQAWAKRIKGLRANASRKSHAELNDSTELDTGNPVELGGEYAMLKKLHLPHLNVMGGCCGTDDRHIEQIAAACMPLFGRSDRA